MSRQVLVLGAAGRFGFSVSEAFRDAGWTVKGLVRPRRGNAVPRGVEPVEEVSREGAVEQAQGCDVVVNALNPAISQWQRNGMALAYSAIAAAEAAGATLIFPGNVWNFGAGMPAVLDENTPMNATGRKGRMRADMELRMREACDRGMRAIVLRAGDFFGAGRGSWMDLVIMKDIARNRLTYPGPRDVVHEWTYLPDFAKTTVRLAERRAEFSAYESFGFPGHAVTGDELIAAIEAVTRNTFNVRPMSWWLIKTFGQVLTIGRELAELEYLWNVPHRISGERLEAAIGNIPHTPLNRAIAETLHALGYRT